MEKAQEWWCDKCGRWIPMPGHANDCPTLSLMGDEPSADEPEPKRRGRKAAAPEPEPASAEAEAEAPDKEE